MIRRRFGRTEIEMPVITCGGMRYQQSWKDEPPESITSENQKNLEHCIHYAVENGINHIETARGYGSSEQQLGHVLPSFPRDKIIVQTKVAPAETEKEFLKTFEKSMANLRLDHIDLLGIHGINTPELLDLTLRKGGALETARKLQKDGRVRFVGFSTHAEVDTIINAINSDEFDYVNLHWYYVNQVNWPAIEAARQHDMGVFIISPNDKGGKLYAPSEKLSRLCEPLSPMVFNDLFCLSRPEVHTLSMGVARASDFDEHLNALKWMDKASEILPPIIQCLDAEIEKTIGPLWPLEWSAGIPDSTKMPGNINVREIVRLWVMAKSFDMVEFAKERYNLFGEGGHWFPGLQAVDIDAAKLHPLIHSSSLRERIPQILSEAHEWFAAEQKKRLSQGE